MSTAMTTRELDEAMRSQDAPQLIDVRRRPAFDASTRMIVGATWRDPEEIEAWSSRLDPERDVVVYCVHGHQISQGCAARLGKAGFRGAYLEGGIEQWVAEDRRTEIKT